MNSRYQKCKNLLYLKEKFEDKYAKNEKYRKVRDHCYYTNEVRVAAQSLCILKYSLPK